MTPLDRELIAALKNSPVPMTKAQLLEKSSIAQDANAVKTALHRLEKQGYVLVDGARQEVRLPEVDPIIKAMDGIERSSIPDADLHAQRLCVLASNPMIAQPVADWLYQLADLISPGRNDS